MPNRIQENWPEPAPDHRPRHESVPYHLTNDILWVASRSPARTLAR
jgi:hypothetical protein